MISSDEEPLLGGRTTLAVVKIGNTVRRSNPNPNALAAPLLKFLKERDFQGAPRFLGMDELGREMLTYIPGIVPREFWHHSDEQLDAAARLLRAFHDATAEFPGRDGAEVVCHNDFAPGNCVYVDGCPSAMIDFDLVAPGTRMWDLGYTVPTFLNLGDPNYTVETQLHRMRLFAGSYGLGADALRDLAVHIAANLASCARWAQDIDCPDLAEWASSRRDWTVTHILDRLLLSRRGRINWVRAPEVARERPVPATWEDWERLVRA